MVLRDGDLVLGDLAERLDEVDDCVAVEVARAGEDTIDGNDHALRTETKNKIILFDRTRKIRSTLNQILNFTQPGFVIYKI